MPAGQDNVYIVDGLRTALATPFKGLKDVTVGQMSAQLMAEIMRRNRIDGRDVSQVIVGNTVAAGTGQNIARQAGFLAGLPHEVPAFTVNNVCASGLQAVILAAQAIRSEAGGLVLAAGAESVTHTPLLTGKDAVGEDQGKAHTAVDSLIYDGLWCMLTGKHMGELCEGTAAKFGIGRKAQDEFALESHRLAVAARDNGAFDREIVGIVAPRRKSFERDERPRKNVTLQRLANLPPAFCRNGTITAGNSSIPCDGAACVAVAGEGLVKANRLNVRARLVGSASVAVHPLDVFEAAVPAVEACLADSGLRLEDIDLFEVSEAFAVQALLTRQRLKIPVSKMNVRGGDVALGHPLGASGLRILVTLIHALEDLKKKRGLACVCLGGGGAVAVVIERVTRSTQQYLFQ